MAGDLTITFSGKHNAYRNPFWHPVNNNLDYKQYIEYYGFNVPDVYVIMFTLNDLSGWDTDSTILNLMTSIKTIIDKFHSDYPLCKVIFSIEPFGSFYGNAINVDGRLYSTLRFAELMFLEYEDNVLYNTWFQIAPSYAYVDIVYGYGKANVVASDRFPNY